MAQPVDHRFDPYRDRVARLLRDGRLAGYAHLVMEVWWPVTGLFRRWKSGSGRELPHWHVALRQDDDRWRYTDTVADDVAGELEDLAASRFEWGSETFVLEWLDGVDAETVAQEYFV